MTQAKAFKLVLTHEVGNVASGKARLCNGLSNGQMWACEINVFHTIMVP